MRGSAGRVDLTTTRKGHLRATIQLIEEYSLYHWVPPVVSHTIQRNTGLYRVLKRKQPQLAVQVIIIWRCTTGGVTARRCSTGGVVLSVHADSFAAERTRLLKRSLEHIVAADIGVTD